jgi:hypothetical protein
MHRNPIHCILLFSVPILLAVSASGASARTEVLESLFKDPPPTARLHAYWFWMGTHISKEGITKDLEAMHAAGLGGVLIMNIGAGVQSSPWPERTYRSPYYWEALRHAATEAHRLDMKINLTNGPGYDGTGGPWIDEARNMRKVVWSQTKIEGGKDVDVTLPRPELPIYTWYGKTDKATIYDDIVVLAAPSQPTIKLDQVIDLSKAMQKDGKLRWKAPAGNWTLYRFGYAPTMSYPHPPLEGIKALEVDKMSEADNIYHWTTGVIAPLKKHLGRHVGTTLNMLHIDSYECGMQNWTREFRDVFTKRKGYDPAPWLVTLGTPLLGLPPGRYNYGALMTDGLPRNEESKFIDSEERTSRFEWDYRENISRMFNDNWKVGRKIMNAEKIGFSFEPNGGPFSIYEGAAIADFPMATFWTTRNLLPETLQMDGTGIADASILGGARAAGTKIIGAESFTSMAQVSRWTESPAQLKFLSDGAFSAGVNKMVLHQWVHQPYDDRYQPGMTMTQWGVHFSRFQTWFEPGKAFFAYINRCQLLLQQGEEVVDILSLDKPTGYSDVITSHDFIADRTRMENGRIVLSSGRKYYVLSIPEGKRMLPEVAEKIRALVAQGAIIASPRPEKSPSLKNYPECDQEIEQFATELWSGEVYVKQIFAKVADAIKAIALAPDYLVEGGGKPEEVRILHRSAPEAEIYFMANRSSEQHHWRVSFRVAGKEPELWQAEDASIVPAPVWEEKAGRTSVSLDLKGKQSIFVVFRKNRGGQVHVTKVTPKDNGTAWEVKADAAGNPILLSTGDFSAKVDYSSGSAREIALKATPEVALGGNWRVSFAPKLGEKFELDFPKLVDFSLHPNKDVNYFSGTATYRQELTQAQPKTDERVILDLGEVNDIVTVKVNGSRETVLWYPPYRLDITESMKAGTNSLEVAVTTNWANAVIGDEQIPADFKIAALGRLGGRSMSDLPDWFLKNTPRPSKRKTFAIWNYFDQNSKLQPAGMVGPVRLVRQHSVQLAPAHSNSRAP